mgnify:CR=1 FL=1
MKKPNGILVIVSGPSGAGKSTIISRVSRQRDDIRFSVSATTRKPREGETDGKDYYFKTREEFRDMIRANAFLEYAEYVGNSYGTPAAPVEESLAAGYNVILDIEVQGAAQVMEKRPDAVSVFLFPPSLEELERRLRSRGTDTEEKIRERLLTARREYAQADQYGYIIINDDADVAVRQLDAIITAEKCRSKYILEGENRL